MKKYLLLLLAAVGLFGCSNSYEQNLSLEGRIAMKGASPHNYLVVEDQQSHTSYKIKNSKAFDLETRQNQILKLEAKLVKKAVGPGFPAEIEVVKVKN